VYGDQDGLADGSVLHMARSCSGSSVGGVLMGQPEQLGGWQRSSRRLGRRGAHFRRGSVNMLRGRGLTRAVRGELEKAAASAQAGQASMQVL
jgi:hypothetical protein